VTIANAGSVVSTDPPGIGGQRNARSNVRTLAGFCEAARVRSAFCFLRDTLDPAGGRGDG